MYETFPQQKFKKPNLPEILIVYLKLVSAIFYQILIFSQNDSRLKTIKNVLSPFSSQDIQIFVIFSFPSHTFQIQKDKWKWNNL